MNIRLAAVVAVAVAGLLAIPRSAHADTGAYLDIATWPSIDQSTRIGPEGVPQPLYASGYEDNPVTVEQWALQHWTYWTQTGVQADLDDAMQGADWLLDHQNPDGTWTYTFDFSGAGAVMVAPWVSALAQGQAMSMLVRAYDHTGDQRYLDAAALALAPFSIRADQGGVLSDFDGDPWYEEYTTPPLHVLNGFEFALVGLHDLAEYDQDAQQPYDAGVTSLERHVGVYDVPSAHNELYGALGASRMTVTGTYPRIQATLTRYLATLTGDQTLKDYANRWEGYLTWRPPAPAVTPPAVNTPAAPSGAPSSNARKVHRTRGCHVGRWAVKRRGPVSCLHARHALRRWVLWRRTRGTWRCYTRKLAHCRRGAAAATVRPAAWGRER